MPSPTADPAVLSYRCRGVGSLGRPACQRGDLVSQRREEPNARSQASFDRNEGETARYPPAQFKYPIAGTTRSPHPRACRGTAAGRQGAASSCPRRWSSRPRPPRCCRHLQSSPGELEPVFDAMLGNAVRICGANLARSICTTEKLTAPSRFHNAPPAFVEARRRQHAFDRRRTGRWACRRNEAGGSYRRHRDDAVLYRARSVHGRRSRSRGRSHRRSSFRC